MVKTKKNKKIKDELLRLREIEKHISKLDRERSRLEVQLVKEAGGPSQAFRKKRSRHSIGSYLFERFRKRRLIYFIVTSIGAVMLWVGAWAIIEKYVINPWVAIAGGITIIWFTRHYE